MRTGAKINLDTQEMLLLNCFKIKIEKEACASGYSFNEMSTLLAKEYRPFFSTFKRYYLLVEAEHYAIQSNRWKKILEDNIKSENGSQNAS